MGKYAGFSKVQLKKPERSKFDLSHEKKLSTRMGRLTPVFISETLPNDTFRVNTEIMLRFAPLLAPIFHRVNVFIHFFFIPMRLLYKDWEKLITNGRLGTETPPQAPYSVIGNMLQENLDLFDVGSLWDYLGGRNIPDADFALWQAAGSTGSQRDISPLPLAAYYKCWYDYYRDRNYVDDNELLPMPSGLISVGQGFVEFASIRTRAWQHDYFTSSLAFTQRGEEVLLPVSLAGYAPIVTGGDGSIDYWSLQAQTFPGAGSADRDIPTDVDAPVGTATPATPDESNLWANLNFTEDQTSGFQTSINDLRQAIRLQEWFERNAVAGSRYNESIMAHFARRTSDGRLQRAEYLGGGRVPVQISEVMTTAFSLDADDAVVPPATMTGRGATYSNKNRFKYNCEEHGFVLGIMSVMPNSGYMQGIPRMFLNRKTFLDWPWPSFAHLGEQEVYDYEIYADPGTVPNGTDGVDGPASVFGYQSRYADWKFIASTAHGDFRTTLDYWHLDRKFSALPTLDETFVTFEDALQDRIFAVAEVDTLWCYVHNQVSVVRSLPYFGTPRL